MNEIEYDYHTRMTSYQTRDLNLQENSQREFETGNKFR